MKSEELEAKLLDIVDNNCTPHGVDRVAIVTQFLEEIIKLLDVPRS